MQELDSLIIGGGPAGCQCALWLSMLGFSCTLVERTDRLGGLLATSPYPNNWLVGNIHQTGQITAANITQHILDTPDIKLMMNAEIAAFTVSNKEFVFEINNKIFKSKTAVIATGVLPNAANFIADPKAVLIGPSQYVYDFDFKDKRVAIFGGGDNAAENYQIIFEKKPKQIDLYARSIHAREALMEAVPSTHTYLGNYLADQQNMSVELEGNRQYYDVFLVFYGWHAHIPKFLGNSIAQKILLPNGFIDTNINRATKVPGLYAIGEVTKSTHPCAITAMADGVIAAKAIEQFLKK